MFSGVILGATIVLTFLHVTDFWIDTVAIDVRARPAVAVFIAPLVALLMAGLVAARGMRGHRTHEVAFVVIGLLAASSIV